MSKGLPRSLARGNPQVQEIIKQTFRVENLVLQFTGSTGVVVFDTAVIGDLPEGNVLLLGAAGYLAFAGSGADANLSDTWAGDFSIGTAPTADNSLAGAEVDVLASTAIGPASSEAIARTRAVNGTPVMLDNTDGSLELNLNALVDADDVANGQTSDITVNGEITLLYSVLLDD